VVSLLLLSALLLLLHLLHFDLLLAFFAMD
jgi:hypothetical protein